MSENGSERYGKCRGDLWGGTYSSNNNNRTNNRNNNSNTIININNQFDGIQVLQTRRNNTHGLSENWNGQGLESRWDN